MESSTFHGMCRGPSASSSVIVEHLMDTIVRLAAVDPQYQELVAQHAHLGLVVQDGLVYSVTGLLYIPNDSELRTTLMREVHDAPTGGHLGREKTYARLTEVCILAWSVRRRS